MSSAAESTVSAVSYRRPTAADGARVHALIDECKPLDLNSLYCYLLLCSHFAATCAVAERNGEMMGFVSGYRKPEDAETLFIWQVAVSPRARGFGVGKGLLREVLSRPESRDIRHLEATINPSNKASWALFESLARERNAGCTREQFFRREDFGTEVHEEETLLRISPI